MPFQTAVNANQAPGLEGGFCSDNEHFSALTPSTGDPALPNYAAWTAAAAGVIVGRFAFGSITTGQVSSAHPGTAQVRCGFVHRYHPVLITTWLGQSSMLLTGGLEVDLVDSMDAWVRFAAGASYGQKVFASFADGSAIAGTAGSAPTTTYSVTTANGSPNLTGVGAGAFAGQPITGTGIPANTYLVSVNPGAGTAVMSANATASATITATATTAFETRWFVNSNAGSGELAKTSTRG